MKNNRFYLFIFLLLLSFSITSDTEYKEVLKNYDGDGFSDIHELANTNDPFDLNDVNKVSDDDGYFNQNGVDAFPLDPNSWLEEVASIEVNQTGALDFTFTYADSSKVIAGVKVVMTESDGTVTVLTTNSSGQITLPSTTNTFTLGASLAETGEDPVSLVDAIQIVQYAGELRTLTANQLKAADVNNDGEVDVLDALWILQHLGELRTLDSNLIFLDANTGKPLSETTFSPGDAISINSIRTGDVDQDYNPTPITQNNPDFECNKPYYLAKPDSVATDAAYNYYEYYWQSNPKQCINFRETDLLEDEWEIKIPNIMNYFKNYLGLIVPLNAFIVDQKNASQATLDQLDVDACNLWFIPHGADPDVCATTQDAWGNRSAAAGVGYEQLPNGGDLYFFRNNWADQVDDPGVAERILMHEYYHVYQNSMKYYFEDTARFGAPIRFEQNGPGYGEGERVRTFPGWLEEGGADFAGMILATKYDNNIDARKQFEDHLDEAKSVISTAASNSDTVSLKDYEYQGGLYESTSNPNNGVARQFAYQYTGGTWAMVYLWSLDNANFKKIMVDYYEIYAEKDQLNPGEGWKDAFEETFGMTLSNFYEEFDAFMLQDKATIMQALKTNAQMQEASITPVTALTIRVNVAANANGYGDVYVIDGTQKKSLTLQQGVTYTFNHPTGHPLRFSTTEDGTFQGGQAYTSGVDISSAGVTIIEVTADTPTNLYYYCLIHSGMGGSITVSN